MFDAIEAINDIIDDINDDTMEYAESCYEDIYEELCYRVESGELTLEEAELINDKAYDMYMSEATRYKVEQERLARKIHDEKRKISKLNSKLDSLERIRKGLIKKGIFEYHKNNYEEKKNAILSKIQQSTELLEKMKKSKLYTGEENVIATKPDGSKEKKQIHVGSTLYYGKERAKREAENREDIKRYGFAVVNDNEEKAEKRLINLRKKMDQKRGLTS